MVHIHTRYEGPRGCGHRNPGGLYLVGEGGGRPCRKLPIILDVCLTCGGGIRPSRGWTWVDGDHLCDTDTPCEPECPLGEPGLGRCGLLWVGGSYYPTPEAFQAEAATRGVCRRIPAVPRGFKVGKTWVLLAHREAGTEDGVERAIFACFRPQHVEYVVTGQESEEELEAMAERGITLVRVIPLAGPSKTAPEAEGEEEP